MGADMCFQTLIRFEDQKLDWQAGYDLIKKKAKERYEKDLKNNGEKIEDEANYFVTEDEYTVAEAESYLDDIKKVETDGSRELITTRLKEV